MRYELVFRLLSGFLVMAAILIAQSPAHSQTGDRVALVIGNSNYSPESRWTPLPNAARDAEHIAELLAHPARGEAQFEVELVTDGTLDEIIDALTAFGDRAANADVAIVYFAGHGIEYGLQNYIVPVDAPASLSPDTINAYYINMAAIVAAAETQGFSIFFLDACRSAVQTRRFADLPEGSRASFFGAVDAPNSVVFYATAMGDEAYDAVPDDHPLSPFATAVGRGISFPGLDLPYVFTHVREHVANVTAHFDKPQFPQFAGSWSRPFYFLPPGSSPLPAIDIESQEVEQAPPPQRLDIPLETLSTVDEPILVVRLLEQYSVEDLTAMAESGDPLALYLVGYMYANGVAVEEDLTEARRWLELAAETDHPAGLLELGYFLSRHGTPDEHPRALSLMRSASDLGYAKAKSHLAAVLLVGTLGVTDVAEATRLYREAADLGHAWAHYALVLRRDRPDVQIAALEALASADNDEGHNWLCEISQAGFEIDRAFEHCLQAARVGYSIPRAYTAIMYATGDGIAASQSRARYWAQLAVDSADLNPMLKSRMEAILSEG